jgi:hypothetical protein
MQAYVFGRHDGEPPTHLVGQTFGGVTVQSMTALEGVDHTLFTKLHVDNPAALSTPMSGEDPVGDIVNDAMVILGCHSPDCSDLIANIESRISFIGREHAYFCFILCDVVGALDHLPEHERDLGTDRIAAATDGNGRVVIEIAGDDPDELTARAARITHHPAIRSASIYLSRDLVRAPQ